MTSEILSTVQKNVVMPPCVLVADDDPEIRQMLASNVEPGLRTPSKLFPCCVLTC